MLGRGIVPPMRSDVHVHVHIEPDHRTLDALDRIESRLAGLTTGVDEMALDFTQLSNDVTANTDAVSSASTLLDSLAAEIRATAGDPAAVAALADRLEQNTANLAAAVAANTPQAPPVGS